MASNAFGVPTPDNLNYAGGVPSVADMTVNNFGSQNPAIFDYLFGSNSPIQAGNTVAPTSILWGFIGIVVLLAVLKYASEHEKSKMELGHMRVGVWNFVVVAVMAVIGINVLKVLANKWGQIPGLTTIINNS